MKSRNLFDDIDRIHEMLREKDQAREVSIKKLRLLIRTCGDGIRCLHRGDSQSADESVKAAQACLAEISQELGKHPDLVTSNSVHAGMAEYVELVVVQKLLTERRIPAIDEVGVPPIAYLNGIGDAIGEVRRHILNLLRHWETEKAEEYLEIAENMYDMLMGFDYPKAIVGGLRRKQDVARSLLEKTRADVTNAVLQKDLSDRLEAHKG